MDIDVAALVAAAFGLDRPDAAPVFVARGAMGEIWRIETGMGRWAVKELFEWNPAPPLPGDVAVQSAAADAGVRLPRPVLGADGRAVVECAGRRFRVYEWVDLGEPLVSPVSADRASEAGEILGAIHALGVPVDDGIDYWYTTAPDPARWSRLAFRAQHAATDWADSLEDRAGQLAELGGFVARAVTGPPVLCHRDFDLSNVIPADQAGRLVTLDWENAGPLDPAAEVAAALLSWTAADGVVDEAAVEALLRGYTSAAGTLPCLTRDSFAIAAATYLNFLATMSDQALEDGRHRSYAQEQVGRLVGGYDQLVGGIDALLDLLQVPGPRRR